MTRQRIAEFSRRFEKEFGFLPSAAKGVDKAEALAGAALWGWDQAHEYLATLQATYTMDVTGEAADGILQPALEAFRAEKPFHYRGSDWVVYSVARGAGIPSVVQLRRYTEPTP